MPRETNLPDEAELTSFVRECIAYFTPTEALQIPNENNRDFRMIFGVCTQTVRFADAYLILAERGHGIEGHTLARAAVEHSATAQFAYLSVDGLDMLASSAEWSSRSLGDRMAAWTSDERFRVPAPSAAEGAIPGLPPVTPRRGGPSILGALDPERVLLEPAYALLSQSVHVTNRTLTSYFTMSEDRGTMRMVPNPPDHLARETLFIVAAACMFVTWIYAHVRQDAETLAQLDRISDAFNLPTRLDGTWTDDMRARGV